MARETTRIPLIVMSPGTGRAITVYPYGAKGARPKAYLQAGIHADEIPGMLVLHHLVRRLRLERCCLGEYRSNACHTGIQVPPCSSGMISK